MEESDSELIMKILSGDSNSFAPLLRRYQGLIFKIIMKYIPQNQIEEVSQESAIRIFKALANFNYKSSFKTWLTTIVTRSCYDYWRKHSKLQEDNFSSLQNELTESQQDWIDSITSDSSITSFNEQIKKDEAKEVLDLLFNHLGAEDRMVLTLIHLDGYSIKDAAEQLCWSESNTKVRSFRAKLRLRELLEKLVQEGKVNV